MANPDDQHPDYKQYFPVWQKCRDAVSGQRAIKAATSAYLPLLMGHTGITDPAYISYIARGNYFNATGRTVDTLAGLVFRKDMTIEMPESLRDEWLNDISLTEETIQDFAEGCLREMLQTERPGILVDMPALADNVVTVAQASQQNLRPYMAIYKAESILNWQMARINNAYRLCNVWLKEADTEKDGKKTSHVRQLTLNESGQYQQVLWQKIDGQTEWTSTTVTPKLNGQPFNEIPFFPLGKNKPTMNLSGPPIESLADLNIAHYQNSVDLEHILHMSSVPTLFIFGHDPGESAPPINLGSSTAVILPEQGADAKFVQCGTDGILPLKEAMAEKVQQMAALGSRIIAPEKKQSETAETANIRRGSENSTLSAVAGVLERQLEKALQFMVAWAGFSDTVTVELNRDYQAWNLTAQDITALVAARQSGHISKEMFFNILKYAELVDDNMTFEDYESQIENDGPALGELNDDAT